MSCLVYLLIVYYILYAHRQLNSAQSQCRIIKLVNDISKDSLSTGLCRQSHNIII